MRFFFMLLALILTFPILSCGNGSDVSSDASSLSLLYLQEAQSGGNLSAVGETANTYTLTLNNVGPTMYVADRPNRVSGTEATSEFVADWDSNNFDTDPPNAVLEVNNLLGDPSTMALELSNPLYDTATQTLTYTALRLETYPSFYPTSAHDADISGDFTSATLFIDNGATISTPVSFSFSSFDNNGGNLEIILDSDNDLSFGMTGNSRTPSFSISNPQEGFTLSTLSMTPNALLIGFPSNGNASNFTLLVYLVGSSPIMSAEAIIPSGISVDMTINGVTNTISSGNISVVLQ